MKVSVVIPAYNEEVYIEKCLCSVINQTMKADEIIVVDNNSTDKTAKIARGLGVNVVSEKTQGMTPARNKGFNTARYDIIARCDADTLVPNDWIEIIKKNFESRDIDGLSGPVYFYDSKFLKSAKTYPSKIILESFKLMSKGKRHMMGPNMALTKKIWEKVKDIVVLDDAKVHEDMDLSLKIAKVDGIVAYDKNLVVGISARRLINDPGSYFLEYPVRIVKTFLINEKGENFVK